MAAPVTWVGHDRKKWLIRGTPLPLLIWVVKACARRSDVVFGFLSSNTPETIPALAREALSRPGLTPSQRAVCSHVAGLPCACGGPGLYVFGSDTYCRACVGIARAKRVSIGRMKDKQITEGEKTFAPLRRERLHKERYQSATHSGRRGGTRGSR